MPFARGIGPLKLIIIFALVLFFPIVFGSTSAIVASRKGLNGFLEFILGAVLGIIGLVIILIIPRKK